MKTYELEFKTNQIEPKDLRPLILNEAIVLDVDFDAAKGFTFSFDELNINHTDTDYRQGLQSFYGKFYERLIEIAKVYSRDRKSTAEWKTVARLMNNPESLAK